VDTLLLFALVTVSELVMGLASRLLPMDYLVTLYSISLPWLCMVFICYLCVNLFSRWQSVRQARGYMFFNKQHPAYAY
jgi:hypothetical protein